LVAVASTRIFPASSAPRNGPIETEIMCTLPAATSVTAGVAPRYGTWIMEMPASRANWSAAKCMVVPFPADA
jgi:hypothetical protein